MHQPLLRTYMGNMHTPKSFNYFLSTAPSSNPLLPAVVSLGVVVLLLITCVALLVLALAVTATKLNRLRAEKGHTDPPHYTNKTGGGEGKTMERIYDEVGEGTGTIYRRTLPRVETGDNGKETVCDPAWRRTPVLKPS